jgi:hypothetical protein
MARYPPIPWRRWRQFDGVAASAAAAARRETRRQHCGSGGGGGSLVAVQRWLSYAQFQVLLGFIYLNLYRTKSYKLTFYHQLHSSSTFHSKIGHFDQNNN